VVFEIAEEAFEFLLHLADFDLLFFASFGGEVRLLFFELLFPCFQAQAFVVGFAQVRVQLVEEVSDVAGLGAEAGAGAVDDGGI
jgi:hypothetical protein